ncbi:MAG TPA: hypothetical protein VF665_07265 [Longimicrobium sp.]|jgi:hypothetical protein|uniref:hypothetical protein n=1 Tax=Longimicrobium sp. TaxID=2029185 RepID=UPI002EDA4CCC
MTIRIPIRIAARRTAAALACLVAAAACADQPTGPASLETTAAAGPRLVPNAVRYRDSGRKPATGRAGGASLSMLALLDNAGVTHVELVSGTAARPGTGAGTLLDVQSILGARHEPARDFRGTGGGRLTYELRGARRGTPLALRATVRGDGGRTEAVTVRDSVFLRPDLRVSVHGPRRVRPRAPVNITALVSERNGDVGARAHCVLYVDGAPADRAEGIWVDAGDDVTCAFTHSFLTGGAHRVDVRVQNLAPADFDPSDNTSGTEILVDVAWTGYAAEARDSRGTSSYASSWEFREAGGLAGVDQRNESESYADQYASTYGWLPGHLAFPVRARLSQSSGGNTYSDTTLTGLGSGSAGGLFCASALADAAGETVFHLCTEGAGPGAATMWQYERWSGSVAYHSSVYSARWDPAGTAGYVYTQSSASGSGTDSPVYGSTFSFRVTLTDAVGRVYQANSSLALQPFSWFYESPEQCSFTNNAVYTWAAYCWSSSEENTTLSGWAQYDW